MLTDRRTPDAGVTGILIAHLEAFGSGELKIGKGMPKIESEKQFLTLIKGPKSVLICQNLPICNPRTFLPNINSHSKFEENWLKNAPSRE